jgi:hypothetical protein
LKDKQGLCFQFLIGLGMYCRALDNYIPNLNQTLAHTGKFGSIIDEIKVTYPLKRSEILLWSEKYVMRS